MHLRKHLVVMALPKHAGGNQSKDHKPHGHD
jgi:hypothetical protein